MHTHYCGFKYFFSSVTLLKFVESTFAFRTVQALKANMEQVTMMPRFSKLGDPFNCNTAALQSSSLKHPKTLKSITSIKASLYTHVGQVVTNTTRSYPPRNGLKFLEHLSKQHSSSSLSRLNQEKSDILSIVLKILTLPLKNGILLNDIKWLLSRCHYHLNLFGFIRQLDLSKKTFEAATQEDPTNLGRFAKDTANIVSKIKKLNDPTTGITDSTSNNQQQQQTINNNKQSTRVTSTTTTNNQQQQIINNNKQSTTINYKQQTINNKQQTINNSKQPTTTTTNNQQQQTINNNKQQTIKTNNQQQRFA
ncbi:hypothetical protein ACTFIU_010898 [Dictyostelium citrinum]